MKNLFNQADVSSILARIDKLTPDASSQWGKMNAAQILAHCNAALGTAAALNFPPRLFIGRILAPFMKAKFISEKVFDKNYPTDKSYVFRADMNFDAEKRKVIALIKRFSEGGAAQCTTHPHSFYGQLTPQEWAITQWKHFDHHLRQFGV